MPIGKNIAKGSFTPSGIPSFLNTAYIIPVSIAYNISMRISAGK